MIVPVYQGELVEFPRREVPPLTPFGTPSAEISPPHARGLLSGWTQLMIVWGFFFANWYVPPLVNLDASKLILLLDKGSATDVNS